MNVISKIFNFLKQENGLILRGGCAVAFLVILGVGTLIGIITGFVYGDWSIFYGCGALLILNIIINSIIHGVNKAKEKRYYRNVYNDVYTNFNKFNEKVDECFPIKKDDKNNSIGDFKQKINENNSNEHILNSNIEVKKNYDIDNELHNSKEYSIFCYNCGNKLPNSAYFCNKCGCKVKK